MNVHPRRRSEPVEPAELAELLPAPGDPVLLPDRHRVLKEHLMRQIARKKPAGTVGDEVRGTRFRRRLAVVAAPLALAATVVLGAVATDRGDERDTAATAAEHREAVRLLDRIATATATRAALPVRDDQYVYTERRGSQRMLGMDPGDGSVRREQWEAVDGERDGLIRIAPLSPDGHSPDASKAEDVPIYGQGGPGYRQLKAMPTDPEALREKLYADTEGQGPTQEEAVFERIGSMLDEATLLPDLGAALYRTAAQLPGFRVAHDVRDAAGRPGVGLTFHDSSSGDITWVFDPADLTYLGTTEIALLKVAVTDRAGETPAG